MVLTIQTIIQTMQSAIMRSRRLPPPQLLTKEEIESLERGGPNDEKTT